jgi:pimeloyl-ACP methyl ester carboxylesterase
MWQLCSKLSESGKDSRMPMVKAGELMMHCEITGDGPPLVLLMGLGCPGSLWWLQVEAFANYRVVVPGNRGVGQTDKPAGEYSTAQMADDTATLLSALGIARAHILGMSMGGAMAQQMALRYPAMVDHLILACTFCETSPYGLETMATWRLIAERAGMDALRRLLLLQFVTPRFYSQHPDRVTKLGELFAAHPQPVDAYGRQNGACARHYTTDQLPRITAPTLVLAAERNILTPLGSMKLLQQQIPGAKLVVLPRSGHGFMWEIPEQFNAAVLGFLGT